MILLSSPIKLSLGALVIVAVAGCTSGNEGGGAGGTTSSGNPSSSNGASSSKSSSGASSSRSSSGASSSGSSTGASSSSRSSSSSSAGSSSGYVTGAMPTSTQVIYLHHSTGGVIWGGGVPEAVTAYNTSKSTTYSITQRDFPQDSPYGWKNYPYDYWNIWVNHGDEPTWDNEPKLDELTKTYGVIVFKHCFPVSQVDVDGTPSVSDETKTVANYKLQYQALKTKLHSYPKTRFIVWTGAALRESETSEPEATRAKSFFDWVKATWDEKGDNIFVWDFRQLETEGGLYLLPDNASSDSHPNDTFAAKAAPLFVKRLADVLEGRGDTGSLTGE